MRDSISACYRLLARKFITPSSAVVQGTDWTVGTILDQIEKDRIQLNPNFQRRDAWTIQRKSRFIESLMVGFPIPQIVLAESRKERGKFIVIDGKQRLLSLLQFAGSTERPAPVERLRLEGLEILDQYNGTTWDKLQSNGPVADLVEFENRTIRTVVIRHWQQDAVLYHIFLRLNTGSVQLSPQELRNALHPGPFADFIDIYSSESPTLRRILRINRPDFRMRDAELLIRYYAFRNFLPRYAGSMKEFLDLTTQQLNEKWQSAEAEIRQQAEQFEAAVGLAYEVFGSSDTFRKWKDGGFSGRFNRAVYDIVIFYFCRPEIRDRVLQHAADVKQAFVDLSRSHSAFVDALESTTKSLRATQTRLLLWTQALNQTLDLDLPLPQLVDNRIMFVD